eukprot:403336294
MEEQEKKNEKKEIMRKIQQQLARQKTNESKEEQKTHAIFEENKNHNTEEQKINTVKIQVTSVTSVNFRSENGGIDRQRDVVVRKNPTFAHQLAGPQDASQSKVITCPDNHHLKSFTYNRPGGYESDLECDDCECTIKCCNKEEYYRCEFAQCDWDICKKCYDKKFIS